TPVDFAYAIHTEVGNHCVGAKVNGRIVPLSYELQMGDRVEILTQKSATPSRGWLGIVKTPGARSKIRSYFSRVTRSDDMQLGHEKLAREMRKHNIGISNAQSTRAIKLVAESLGYKESDDMIVAIGAGKESAQHVANRLLKILVDRGTKEAAMPDIGMSGTATGKMPPMITSVARPKRHETHTSNGIVVKGLNDVLVRLSRCCNPVFGDDIVGFVTRGRGVSVHRADCPNAKNLMKEPERIIDVEWEQGDVSTATYRIEVHIEAMDRMNLLRDVITVLAQEGVNVLNSSSAVGNDGIVRMRYVFQVSDVGHVQDVLLRILEVDGVFEARRMNPGEYVGAGK
ncbi:MAG: bifunctional (p)ppGpp synthetase/guanosine-3',5'-bis(diphosphate) 3'-pyrophosphohydrolase, partial [Eggerthellaceae bacterium]|nr:bifunctional (p)ppGpp synthetase/guanosine-3',5'-bis(diphosphate) 3'-pyrophosphohydrolase [Eggerthellaceae bacterium]